VDQGLVVVAGEKEAALLGVFEVGQQFVGQGLRPLQVGQAEVGLHHGEQGFDEAGMVVQVGVEVGAAIAGRRQQAGPPVHAHPHRAADGVQGLAGRHQPVGP
jgi:hypothetical protein